MRRDQIVRDVLERLRPTNVDEGEWLAKGRKALRHSPLMDITEYGRAVHAEMEALMSCARSGVGTRGASLYCTTFPCHNCAKHVIAAGIRRVVYVEPYPKSQASVLFDDSIQIGSPAQRVPGSARDGRNAVSGHDEARQGEADPGSGGPVKFEPFVGVGPRRFFDLFSMGLSSGTTAKRKIGGKKIEWSHAKGIVRIAMVPNSYLEREELAAQELITLTTRPTEGAS